MSVCYLPRMPETFHARIRRSCLRPAANKAPRQTREKISGTQGMCYRQLLVKSNRSRDLMNMLIAIMDWMKGGITLATIFIPF